MFEDVENDLRFLVEHLQRQDDPGTRIGPVLTTYALMLIHAQFETALKAAIVERCKPIDSAADSYVATTVRRSLRSIKISELSGVLGQFDSSCKAAFQESARQFDVAFQFYSNLEINRQQVAHGGSLEATMEEVKAWFIEAKMVVRKFREALGLTS